MKKTTLGARIAALRKTSGMTQLELAEKMGVTDKAVSKWERDLSCPDINSLPKLAEIFGISVDDLMQAKGAPEQAAAPSKVRELIPLILRGVALAMGIATAVLCFQAQLLGNQVELNSVGGMLGLGLACLAISAFPQGEE